jgi:hypothetical protein
MLVLGNPAFAVFGLELARRCLVEGGGFPLDDLERPSWANVKAGAEAVAEYLARQEGLPLRIQLQRALGAGGGALAAAVAEPSVYLDDLAFHLFPPQRGHQAVIGFPAGKGLARDSVCSNTQGKGMNP